jgi:hypothetical protein
MPTMEGFNPEALFTMLKGEPGTRKSTCALSYPTPQYWISTDQKMEALTLPMKRWGIKAKDIHFDNYTDWDKPEAKLKSFQLSCPYRTVIVDSVTSIGDSMNRQTIKHKRGEGGGKRIGTIYVPGLEEYNAEASAFSDMMALLQDINQYHKVNVIIIAHVVGQRKDDEKNRLTHHSRVIITGGDKISGKIASKMLETYHFDVKSGFAETDEGEYSCFTSHTGNDYARTSLPLERRIVFNSEPLYEKWVAPAIKKLKDMQPIERITQQTQSKPTTPTTTPTPFVK